LLRASATAGSTDSIPTTSPAWRASASEIVPAPQ
jgi:hypothetical protein